MIEQLSFQLSKEEWRPVVGYESLYEVSNFGRIKSLDRRVWNGRVFYTKKGKLLKPTLTTTGYWKVELKKPNERKKSFKVHRLVAFAFIPQEEGKTLINHIDGNPLNNCISNLEWCTQSENMKHAATLQLMPNKFRLHVEDIEYEYMNDKNTTISGLSLKYGCSTSAIKKHFKEKGIKIRSISEANDIYHIDKNVLIQDFKSGMRNVDIARKHKTNRLLIGTYKHKYKNGEL